MEHKTFICANKDCTYISRQNISHVAQEIDDYKLCKECYKKGLRLRKGIIVEYAK